MTMRRYSFHEHELTVLVARGEQISQELVEFYRAMDSTCATRWLKYFDPSADMSGIDLASMPALRRVKQEKRAELFGDHPKHAAVVCGSDAAERHFMEFWVKYADLSERCFRTFDEAYAWLGLSEAARAEVARVLDGEDVEAGLRAAAAPAESAFHGPPPP